MFRKVLYKDLLLYAVYGFLKWKMIQANGSPALFFVSPKFGGSHSYKPFDVP